MDGKILKTRRMKKLRMSAGSRERARSKVMKIVKALTMKKSWTPFRPAAAKDTNGKSPCAKVAQCVEITPRIARPRKASRNS
jgi:hypothetical protein